MFTVPSRRSLTAATCIAGLFIVGAMFVDRPALRADAAKDIDGDSDMLPNDVEWALLTDPELRDTDQDGIDDYAAVVAHIPPSPLEESAAGTGGLQQLGGRSTIDHEARVVLSIRYDADGTPAVWMHYLFRFAGPQLPLIEAIDPWICFGGVQWPINGLIGASQIEVDAAVMPGDRLQVRFSARLAPARDFLALTPSTIGASIRVEGRVISTGVYIADHGGALTAFTPTGANSGVMVPLDPAVAQDPFWNSDRVCFLNLTVLASTGYGNLCEVSQAQCRRSGALRCPPTCTSAAGQVFYVPDGMSTLTGG